MQRRLDEETSASSYVTIRQVIMHCILAKMEIEISTVNDVSVSARRGTMFVHCIRRSTWSYRSKPIFTWTTCSFVPRENRPLPSISLGNQGKLKKVAGGLFEGYEIVCHYHVRICLGFYLCITHEVVASSWLAFAVLSPMCCNSPHSTASGSWVGSGYPYPKRRHPAASTA